LWDEKIYKIYLQVHTDKTDKSSFAGFVGRVCRRFVENFSEVHMGKISVINKNDHVSMVKAKLIMKINRILGERELRQVAAANVLGIGQPKVSAILNGKIDDFSVERLIQFLNELGQDVELRVRTKSRTRRRGVFNVIFA